MADAGIPKAFWIATIICKIVSVDGREQQIKLAEGSVGYCVVFDNREAAKEFGGGREPIMVREASA